MKLATPRWRTPFVLSVLLLLAGLIAPAAGAAPRKPFSADVVPTCVAATTATDFTLTLRNETTTQQLGSANVTPPTGFTLSADPRVVGNVLQLRSLNLPPGGSVTVPFRATTPSTAGSYSWSIIAKQSNDFSGTPGNDLTFRAATSHVTTFVATCEVVFLTQPNNAQVDAAITSADADPAGPPVDVAVEDGSGGRVTTFEGDVTLSIVDGTGTSGASLTPTVPTATATDGVASFDPDNGDGFSIGTAGLNYQVRANAGPGIDAADSQLSGFDIGDAAVLCSGPGCHGSATRDSVIVTVTAPDSDEGDTIFIALDAEGLTCGGYTPLAGTPVVTFEVTGDSHRIVTIRVPADLAVRPAALDRVCYSSDTQFTDRDGNVVNTGLLADCRNRTPLSQPCQFPTQVDRDSGDHIVSFRAPAGATRGRT